MNYGDPEYLPLIGSVLAVLFLFYVWAMNRRRVLMGRFADKKLISGLASSASTGKKITKIVLTLAGIGAALIALARPQWGYQWEEVKRSGIDMLIAVDTSKSMLAGDVKPNRLERSKFAIKDMIKKLKGDRIGLIAFSGTSFLQCPPTIDYNGFLLALDDLNIGTIPRGGTNIGSAIDEAMKSFSGPDKKYKVLIIITDGEELEGNAVKKAQEAAKSGIRIYCIGIGTTEGDLIPYYSGDGGRGYLADKSGSVIKTRLNESVLKEVALSTGGSYIRATQSEFGLVYLYDKVISKLEKRDIESKMKKHYNERFQIFLAIAIVLLAIEPLITERRWGAA